VTHKSKTAKICRTSHYFQQTSLTSQVDTVSKNMFSKNILKTFSTQNNGSLFQSGPSA